MNKFYTRVLRDETRVKKSYTRVLRHETRVNKFYTRVLRHETRVNRDPCHVLMSRIQAARQTTERTAGGTSTATNGPPTLSVSRITRRGDRYLTSCTASPPERLSENLRLAGRRSKESGKRNRQTPFPSVQWSYSSR